MNEPKNKKMIISEKKTKTMIINFSRNYQFMTRLILNNTNIEVVDKIKILGTIITDKLDWDENCNSIIQKVNKRMLFGATNEEMVHLWIIYCRSLLEQSAVVWASSLTQENINDLERTQKSFVKLILKHEFKTEHEKSYENALLKLNLQTLEQRRKELCLNFSKNGVSHDKLKDLFPEKQKLHSMNTRHSEKYEVLFANTERMKKSSIIYMQNLLNSNEQASNKT